MLFSFYKLSNTYILIEIFLSHGVFLITNTNSKSQGFIAILHKILLLSKIFVNFFYNK